MKLAELQESAGRAAALLKALSNASRLLILCQLTDGEKTVSELQRRVHLSQSGLSQHLAVLRRKGIVATRREAQSIHYSLASREAVVVMTALYGVFCSKAAKPLSARERQALLRGALLRGRAA